MKRKWWHETFVFLCVLESMESSVKSGNKANVTVRWSIKKREKEADLDVRNVVYQSSVMYPRRCLCTPPATAASHNAAWESRRDKWETGGRAILSSFFFFWGGVSRCPRGCRLWRSLCEKWWCGDAEGRYGVQLDCIIHTVGAMLHANVPRAWRQSLSPPDNLQLLPPT